MENATDRLRALLREYGIEPSYMQTRVYKGHVNPVHHYTRWDSPYGVCQYQEEESSGMRGYTVFSVCGYDITPEQAVAFMTERSDSYGEA